MSRNSLIIRFIDVALTVLFGFVGVSEIRLRTQIKLPNELTDAMPQQVQPTTLSIRILEGPSYWLLEGKEVLFLTDSQQALEERLVERYQIAVDNRENFIALIEPDPDSPIQLTVDLIDICKRNQIPQNLNYIADDSSN